GRDNGSRDLLGLISFRKGEIVAIKGSHLLKDSVALLQFAKIRRGTTDIVVALRGVVLQDHHKPVRIFEGQRSQQHRVHYAENCSISSDAKGQGQRYDRRKTRSL